MYYDSILPHLSRSTFSSQTVVSDFDCSKLFLPLEDVEDESAFREAMVPFADYLDKQVPRVIHVMPLDIYVIQGEFNHALYYKFKSTPQKVVLSEVNYFEPASVTRNFEIDGQWFSGYPVANGYDLEVVDSVDLINAAASNLPFSSVSDEFDVAFTLPQLDSLHTPDSFSVKTKGALTESVLAEAIPAFPGSGLGKTVSAVSQSSTLVSLEAYLTSNDPTEKTPILLGNTGVAKSSVVKALCAKLGYRLVDLRTAFMTRLDFEGLSELSVIGDQTYSYSAPDANIIECTDGAINLARAAVKKLEEAIAKLPVPTDEFQPYTEETQNYKVLQDSLAQYREKSKIPVLFFDEITRAPDSVRQGMMTILSEKRIGEFKMTLARVVAATNYPVDMPPELEDSFHSEITTDPAFNNRMTPFVVTPESVYPEWLKWGESNGKNGLPNIHPFIISFIKLRVAYGVKAFYDMSSVVDEFNKKNQDPDVLTTTPFPNFRVWEMVSDYLYKLSPEIDASKITTKIGFSSRIIEGLLGKKPADDFVDYLTKESKTHKAEKISDAEALDRSVDDCISRNIPLMIMGPSSIGKSTRIKNWARKHDAEVININLALADRQDVMGSPASVETASYMGGASVGKDPLTGKSQTAISRADPALAIELEKLTALSGLPERITVRAPKLDVEMRFRLALEQGRRVVLFFDEVNRTNNPSLMSVVFEAISDSRIFGISYKGQEDRVSVVAACNVAVADTAENQRAGTSYENIPLDPAFVARFMIFKKEGYDLSDVDAMLNFVESHNPDGKPGSYAPALVAWLKKQDKKDILKMLASVEQSMLNEAKPSQRAFSDLSRILVDPDSYDHLNGTIVFSSQNSVDFLQKVVTNVFNDGTFESDLKQLCDLVKPKLSGWSAIAQNVQVDYEGVTVSAKDLADYFNQYYNYAFNDPSISTLDKGSAFNYLKSVISGIRQADYEVMNLRQDEVKRLLGPDTATSFLDYYNTVSGTSLNWVEVIDIVKNGDEDLIKEFWQQRLGPIPIQQQVGEAVTLLKDFANLAGTTLTSDHYQKVLRSPLSLGFFGPNDTKEEYLRNLVDPALSDLVKLAEAKSSKFALELLVLAGNMESDVTHDFAELQNSLKNTGKASVAAPAGSGILQIERMVR